MSNLQDFHHGTQMRGRMDRWIIGIVLAVVLIGLAAYAYKVIVPPPQPKPAVSDSKLPSP